MTDKNTRNVRRRKVAVFSARITYGARVVTVTAEIILIARYAGRFVCPPVRERIRDDGFGLRTRPEFRE